jgi:acetyl-CoA carboxylase biotin carboxylase subunit
MQIEIADGARLALTQEQIAWRGSAIECRIYAEDPSQNFMPFPGKITRLTRPHGPGIRFDDCVYAGWTVPMEYDPLLAKLAVWSETREASIARMMRALSECEVGGIRTNIGFFRRILEDAEFRAGRLHTSFIDEYFARTPVPGPPAELAVVAALAASLHSRTPAMPSTAAVASSWRETGRRDLLR